MREQAKEKEVRKEKRASLPELSEELVGFCLSAKVLNILKSHSGCCMKKRWLGEE